MSFKNKVILVVGASSGIGAAIAVKFSEEGAEVAIVGRNNDKLKKVAAKCNNALIILADVTNDEDCKRIVSGTVTKFGRIDVLVNSVGNFNNVSIKAENALQVFDNIMATNLRSIVCLTNLAAKYLIETKGNIVNISGIGSLRVLMTNFSHNTAKAALDHFTKTAALDFAQNGVRVNAISPGPVQTDIFESAGYSTAGQATLWETFTEFTALKRISDPEEIADLVLYVASDKAKGMTGSVILYDNGFLLSGGFDSTLSKIENV